MTDIARNLTKERLREDKVAFGLQVRFIRTIDIARLAASCGYHYLFIDLEHSTMGLDMAAQLSVACLDAGVTPTLRVPAGHYYDASRLLDGGAQSIIFPHCDTASEVRAAVDACKFPPVGHRSHTGQTPLLGWQSMPVAESARILNDNMLIGVNIESLKAVDNIEEIMAVDGLDFVAVGSNDLALDMGIPGEFENPKLLACYEKVMAAARRNGVYVRFGGVYDAKLMQRNIEMGARMVTLTGDLKVLLQGMRSTVADFTKRIDAALL